MDMFGGVNQWEKEAITYTYIYSLLYTNILYRKIHKIISYAKDIKQVLDILVTNAIDAVH